MDIQKACEVVEGLLERDIHRRPILATDEFVALNVVLLELAAKGMYEAKSEG